MALYGTCFVARKTEAHRKECVQDALPLYSYQICWFQNILYKPCKALQSRSFSELLCEPSQPFEYSKLFLL